MPRTFYEGRQVKRWKNNGANVKKGYYDGRLVFANNPDPILGRTFVTAQFRIDDIAYHWFNLRTGHAQYGCWRDREPRTEFVALNGYNTPGKHYYQYSDGRIHSYMYQDDWCPGAGTLAWSYWYPGIAVPEVTMYTGIQVYVKANYSRCYVDVLTQPTPANDYNCYVQTYDPFNDGSGGTFVLGVNLTGDSTGAAADYSGLYGTVPDPQPRYHPYSPPESNSCLRFDTLVKMYDGSVKRIVDLVAGDVVMSNRENVLVPGTVMSVRSGGAQATYALSLGSGQLICTDAHPWATASGWKAINAEKANAVGYENLTNIGQLEQGNFMLDEKGGICPLLGIRKTGRIEHVHTVDITDGIDTLYVSGDGSEFYLTHNKRNESK